jgi:anti-sigma factor RsiW
MNCPLLSEQTTDVLLAYSAGRLDATRKLKLEKHMESCVRCAAFRVEQTELWAALDLWEPEPVSMGFNRDLWRKIGDAEAAPWYRKLAESLRSGVWKPAFPLAAAALVIGAGFMFDHTATVSTTSNGSGVSVVSTTEADQVERALDDLQLFEQFDVASSGNSRSASPM